MKLLRLETDSSQGEFEVDFNEDITIGADSQIALHSISAELDAGDLEINSSNNIIKYKLGTDAEKIVTLTNKKYTKLNIHELFNDIQQKLNDSLDGSTVNNGTITFFCNNNGFISFGNDRNKERDFDKPNSRGYDPTAPQQKFVATARTGNTASSNTGQQIFYHSGSDTALNTRYFYQSNMWAKGSSIFRAKVQKFVDNTSGNPDNGFRMVLLDIDPASLNGAAIPEGNIVTSIEFQRPTENYLFKRPGDTTQLDSGQLPVAATIAPGNPRDNNDVMEIAQRDSNIEIRVYQNGQPLPSSFGQAPIPRNTDGSRQDLYPAIIIYGGTNNLQVTDYRCSTKEPVITNAIVGSDLLTGETLGAYPPVFIKKYSKSSKDFTLTIPNSDLYDSLGFEDFATTGGVLTNTGISMDISSSKPFHMTSLSDAIIVDMVNMELDAYDSIQNGHKNILNVIALSDNQTNINYELRNLVFVDMKNRNPRLLRHIKARLLRHDLSPLPTRGKSSLVLLIK